jgi:DNA replication initiation complex subunit (GINS family)
MRRGEKTVTTTTFPFSETTLKLTGKARMLVLRVLVSAEKDARASVEYSADRSDVIRSLRRAAEDFDDAWRLMGRSITRSEITRSGTTAGQDDSKAS